MSYFFNNHRPFLKQKPTPFEEYENYKVVGSSVQKLCSNHTQNFDNYKCFMDKPDLFLTKKSVQVEQQKKRQQLLHKYDCDSRYKQKMDLEHNLVPIALNIAIDFGFFKPSMLMRMIESESFPAWFLLNLSDKLAARLNVLLPKEATLKQRFKILKNAMSSAYMRF